jgi:hypothetical protein
MDKKFVMEITWFMGFYIWEGEKSGNEWNENKYY